MIPLRTHVLVGLSRLAPPAFGLAIALVFAPALSGCSSDRRPRALVAPPDAATAAPPQDRRATNPWFVEGRRAVARAARFVEGQAPARNVILFVGDGMSVATVTAARILEGQQRGEPGEENRLAFETLAHVALVRTYNVDAQVPDSAGTITAILTGVKTKTGVVGVDEHVRRGDHASVAETRVPTLVEEAEARGLATGLVTTTTVTHATPAGCYAHVPARAWEDDSLLTPEARAADFPDIARQLVGLAQGDGLEVALGGGRRHFRPAGSGGAEAVSKAAGASIGSPHGAAAADASGARLDGRDLVRAWQTGRAGSAYVETATALRGLDLERTTRLLGLFAPGDLRWEADRVRDAVDEPSLAEMTGVAIDLLSRDADGYFLLVEGGRIDHGHHMGSAYHALHDTIAFSDAVAVALRKTRPEETLVVVTADHSHTLAFAGYPRRGNAILGKVVGVDFGSTGSDEPSLDASGRPYTTLSYANGPGHVEGGQGRPDLSQVDTTAPDYLQEATVPLPQETHGGEDVAVYAGGPRAALFHGVQEQSYLYHAMVEALGWTRGGEAVEMPVAMPIATPAAATVEDGASRRAAQRPVGARPRE